MLRGKLFELYYHILPTFSLSGMFDFISIVYVTMFMFMVVLIMFRVFNVVLCLVSLSV